MAVYRSDQAQVTFAAEAAQGGDMERYGPTTTSGTSLSSDVVAGASSITVASASNFNQGDLFVLVIRVQHLIQNYGVSKG